MERRDFLRAAAAAAAALLASARASARDAAELRLAVAYEHPGRSIAPSFPGLSYESSVLAAGNYFTPENRSVLGLIAGLGRRGVIRVGGNDSAHGLWRAAGDGTPVPDRFVLTPAAIDRLAAFLRRLGWGLIYGLNLARASPAAAAEEAAYVARAVGRQLIAFQFGNEPDGFARWAGERPAGYGAAAFIAEWQGFRRAVRKRLPHAPLAGPDVAGEIGWVAPFAAAEGSAVRFLTAHYYADGPARDPAVTIARLMTSAGKLQAELGELEAIGRRYRLPFRIAELNSVFNGGRRGVSDTLASALWGLETMFQIAAAGGLGSDFMADDYKVYTPIARRDDGGHYARPLYYGMRAFATMLGGSLVPVRAAGSAAAFAAYAARAGDGTLKVALINKDLAQPMRARIAPGRRFARAALLRLAGPAADATAGITLGGAAIDDIGGWAPKRREMARAESGTAIVELPPASAAVVAFA